MQNLFMMGGSTLLHTDAETFILKPWFATIDCEPSWRWQKRDEPMPDYDLLYVWKGQGDIFLNKQVYQVKENHCFLFKHGDIVTAAHNPQNPLKLTYIHFDIENPPQLIPASHRIIKHPIQLESLLVRYVRLFLSEQYGAETEAKLIIKLLMIHLLREEHERDIQVINGSDHLFEVIQETANYVHQHPGDPHTVESLAKRANLSPRYFSSRFKQIIGQPVKAYIVRSRIKRAEHLLHFTGMTVTETAYALGYNDIHFFSRQFKKYTGKNPSEIR